MLCPDTQERYLCTWGAARTCRARASPTDDLGKSLEPGSNTGQESGIPRTISDCRELRVIVLDSRSNQGGPRFQHTRTMRKPIPRTKETGNPLLRLTWPQARTWLFATVRA